MFVNFGGVITNCFGAYCIGAWLHNIGEYSSQRLYNLSPGLEYLSQGLEYLSQGLFNSSPRLFDDLSQGLGFLSQGLGYLSQGLWGLGYEYIYYGVFVYAVFVIYIL
jgi:hypothetical protein